MNWLFQCNVNFSSLGSYLMKYKFLRVGPLVSLGIEHTYISISFVLNPLSLEIVIIWLVRIKYTLCKAGLKYKDYLNKRVKWTASFSPLYWQLPWSSQLIMRWIEGIESLYAYKTTVRAPLCVLCSCYSTSCYLSNVTLQWDRITSLVYGMIVDPGTLGRRMHFMWHNPEAWDSAVVSGEMS